MDRKPKTKKQVEVLRVLYSLKDLTCQDIGLILNRNPAGVRSQLVLLQGRGLVSRQGHPTRWAATGKGLKAYRTWGGIQTDIAGGSHDPERKEA